ncbi:MAG: phosphatidylserine decarboxylase [Acidobacteriota bacterium]
MVKEVWPYLFAGILLTVVLAWAAGLAYAVAAGIVTVGIAWFFRDPARVVAVNERHVLSPADGRVVGIVPDAHPGQTGGPRVSIFLSIFNVHVNRAPAAGRITGIRYQAGSFLPAFRDKASERNEQNLICMETANGPVAFKQIAGAVARRIRCWKRAGDTVAQGDKVGFITFGSRVDLFLPPNVEMKVTVGEKVRGGLTIIAAYREEARTP